MPDKQLTIEQLLTMLAQTPTRIAALTAEQTPIQLCTGPSLAEWSANDVLAHLRSCADVWGNCITTIIAEDMPTMRPVNPVTWIKKTNYRELDFQHSLDYFAMQRAALLAVLESLPPEGWTRAATVTGAGKPRERNVHNYAWRLAVHERSHIKQIERTATAISRSQP